MISEVYRKGRDAKEASYVLQTAGTDVKNKALAYIADASWPTATPSCRPTPKI